MVLASFAQIDEGKDRNRELGWELETNLTQIRKEDVENYWAFYKDI